MHITTHLSLIATYQHEDFTQTLMFKDENSLALFNDLVTAFRGYYQASGEKVKAIKGLRTATNLPFVIADEGFITADGQPPSARLSLRLAKLLIEQGV